MDQRTGITADATERRKTEATANALWRAQLNEAQRLTLRALERFGWELKFVRRRPFQDPVPVVFDGDRRSFAVLRPDGSLDEKPGFEIRDPHGAQPNVQLARPA